MFGVDDDDMGEFGTSKNRNAKVGRRAKKEEPEPAPAEPPAEDDLMTASESTQERDASGPPRPSRRVSGWGDEPSRRGFRRRKRGMEEYEDERLRPTSPEKDDSDNAPDIPVIPDLEDQQEDDLTTQVAVAPNVAVNRVATYRELDNDLLRHAAFLTLDNEIDLKLLTKGLSSEADVQEEDKAWDWDRLFTEVTSEILAELELSESPEEEKTGA